MALTIQRYTEAAREAIEAANEKAAAQANKHRREPDFNIGDRVFIIKQVVRTDRPSDKLDRLLTE